jgi:hypothetical protein
MRIARGQLFLSSSASMTMMPLGPTPGGGRAAGWIQGAGNANLEDMDRGDRADGPPGGWNRDRSDDEPIDGEGQGVDDAA